MSDAIRAQYSDFKLIKTRSIAQLIFEVPIEEAEAALNLLGIPQPGSQTWCAVAVLQDTMAKEPDRPKQHPLVQQAGILCLDSRFIDWIFDSGIATRFEDTATAVRRHCGIASRRELATNEAAAAKFEKLVARYKSETGQATEKRG